MQFRFTYDQIKRGLIDISNEKTQELKLARIDVMMNDSGFRHLVSSTINYKGRHYDVTSEGNSHLSSDVVLGEDILLWGIIATIKDHEEGSKGSREDIERSLSHLPQYINHVVSLVTSGKMGLGLEDRFWRRALRAHT